MQQEGSPFLWLEGVLYVENQEEAELLSCSSCCGLPLQGDRSGRKGQAGQSKPETTALTSMAGRLRRLDPGASPELSGEHRQGCRRRAPGGRAKDVAGNQGQVRLLGQDRTRSGSERRDPVGPGPGEWSEDRAESLRSSRSNSTPVSASPGPTSEISRPCLSALQTL